MPVPKVNRTLLLHLLFFLIVSSEFLPVVAASPTSSPSLTTELFRREDNSSNTTADAQPLDCTTQFSTDYYGFGVRLGVYFAWVGAYLANTLLPSEIAGSLDTNAIFLLALLVSLFKGSLAHQIQQIDGLIVMQLSSGFLFSSMSIWGYRTTIYQRDGPQGISHFGHFGTHGRLLLTAGISIYGTWFWSEGIKDGLESASDPACKVLYTWFFTPLRVNGGIEVFYIMVSAGCSIFYCSMCLAAAIAVAAKLFREGWKGQMKYETGYNARELRLWYNVMRVYNFIWIALCITMIELTLKDNHMRRTLAKYGDIAFPAQLLPLLAGGLSFLRIVWLIYVEWSKGSEALPSRANLDGTHEHTGAHEHTGPLHAKHPIDSSEATTSGRYSAFLRWLRGHRASHGPADQDNDNDENEDGVALSSRPNYQRYLVALWPWLSTLDFWKHPQGKLSSAEEGSAPTAELKTTGYRENDGVVDHQGLVKRA